MDAPPGRREAQKQATRQALRDAAERLFAERGYEATRVRDIAAAAGVTERTFYRYFGDKSALVAAELLAWLDQLGEEIVARPAAESDLEAVEAAVLKLVRRGESRRLSGWLGGEPRRMAQQVRPTIPRPLIRLEQTIAAALSTRAEAAGRDPSEFRDFLLARVCVAVIRNALMLARAEGDDPRRARLATSLSRGFSVIKEAASADAVDAAPPRRTPHLPHG